MQSVELEEEDENIDLSKVTAEEVFFSFREEEPKKKEQV